MSTKWKGPDGLGFHYATAPNGVRMDVKYTPYKGAWKWSVYLDGVSIPQRFDSCIDAKVAALKAATEQETTDV